MARNNKSKKGGNKKQANSSGASPSDENVSKPTDRSIDEDTREEAVEACIDDDKTEGASATDDKINSALKDSNDPEDKAAKSKSLDDKSSKPGNESELSSSESVYEEADSASGIVEESPSSESQAVEEAESNEASSVKFEDDNLETGTLHADNDSESGTRIEEATIEDVAQLIDKKIVDDKIVEPLLIQAPSNYVAEGRLPARHLLDSAIKSGLSGVPPLPTSASSLLQSKQAQISSRFGSKDRAQQDAITTGIRSIKNTFNEIKSTIDHMPPELLSGPINWEFWTRVVENYDGVVESEQPELLEAVAKGIPKEFRGIVWQSVAKSKSIVMEELYMHLKTEPSIHEKAIKRDLTRTSFFTNVEAVDKAGELFNVIKAYSNFDPDVGYTQGMAFIAIPLIMNMTESECFCLLLTLMKDYEIRELFCPEMKGLHLLLHQFDSLLEKKLPLLFNHLTRQGVRSLMYASQWFLTFFSYKFPLDVVLRIFDVIITQGTEVLIKLAINLMLRNETSLLRLNFDALLEFLKLNLFNIYVSEEFVQSDAPEPKRFPLLSRKPSSKNSCYYRLDDFMQDSMLVEISPLDLSRCKVEFEQMCTEDGERAEEIEKLKEESGKLRHEIKAYETELFTLNHTHVNVVQELVDKKVVLPEILSDIDDLNQGITSLRQDILNLESKLNSNEDNIPQDIESKIQDLLEQNARETERFANLDEQFNNLTIENEQLDAEIKKMPKSWFWNK